MNDGCADIDYVTEPFFHYHKENKKVTWLCQNMYACS